MRCQTVAAALIAALTGLGAADAPKPVRVQTVALVESRPAFTVSGTLQARTQTDLAFRVGGKVIARPVEVGNVVRAGTVLAQLDLADLQFSEEAAQAALTAAEAAAENAQAELRRYEALAVPPRPISPPNTTSAPPPCAPRPPAWSRPNGRWRWPKANGTTVS